MELNDNINNKQK